MAVNFKIVRVRGFMEHRRKARAGEARAGRACRSEARCKETNPVFMVCFSDYA